MTCRACSRIIPDNLVACPYCTAQKNDRAVREAQMVPLAMVADGRAELVLHRAPHGGALHIAMFHTDVAFCGEPADSPKNKRKYVAWDADELQFACQKCRTAVEAAMAEALKRAGV